AYQLIQGSTDSEHIFALLVDELLSDPNVSLTAALRQMLNILTELGEKYQTPFSANLIITDGQQMVASRFASHTPIPTLYWLRDDQSALPESVVIASEPLFPGDWSLLPDRSLLTVHNDLNLQVEPF
ncbi:MAG: class II glutamine amidotransferase, partial [Phormidesmis sp. CAN_BIN44]|nr:class II glutamine amidotransferase [Phormidesmis sp. CAN_BIN44]